MLIGINRRSKSLDSLQNFIHLDELIGNMSITNFKLFTGEYKSLRNSSYVINGNRLNTISEFAPDGRRDIKRSLIKDITTRHGFSTVWFIRKLLDAAKGVFSDQIESFWRFSHFISDDMPHDFYRRGNTSIKRHTLSFESNTILTGFNDVFNHMANEYNPWGIPTQLANKCEKDELRTKENPDNPSDKIPEIKQEKKTRKGNPKSNPNFAWKVSWKWILLILSMVSQSDAIALTKYKDPSALQEYTYSALSTPSCNLGNLVMTQKCQINSDYLEIHMNHCGFKSLCPPHQEPVCVNIERGMVFICAPLERICAKGYRWYPWLDEDNKTVYVKEEKCPKGSFQPYETDCFHACTMTHLNIKDLQEKYLVYSEGDNVSPTYVYCNYKKGYFNREHKFKLDYDRESMHEPYFCSHIDNFNPCSDGLAPLPNGTCVKPCLRDECRDDHDGFICKWNCRYNQSERYFSEAAGDRNRDVDECSEMKVLCENGKCTNSIGSYNCICHDGYELDNITRRCIRTGGRAEDKSTTNFPTLAIVFMVVAVCATVVIVSGCCRHRFCKTTETTESSGGENNEMNGTVPINTRQSLEAVICISENSATDEQRDGTERRDEEDTLRKQENMDVDEMITNDSHDPRSNDKKAFDKVSNGNRKERNHAQAKINQGQQIKNETEEGTDSQEKADEMSHLLPTEEEADLTVCNGDIKPFSNADLQKKDKREQFGPQSVPIFKGKEFRKEFDDTNTGAVHRCLSKCLMSCGALIHNGRCVGTVFRIGTVLIMTAFHVIRDIVKDPTGKSAFDFSLLEQPDTVTVNFNDSVCHAPRRKFRLKYRYHDVETDVAVMEIMQTTGLPKELFLWQYDYTRINVNKVHIIGYGHKENPYEKHVETCAIMNDELRIREALASLHQNRQEYIDDLERNGNDSSIVDLGYSNLKDQNLIKFDTFMTHCSSGAPIIESKDGKSHKVIGIVLGGTPDFYYKLSEEIKSSFQNKYLIECGMKMETIYEKMILSHEELAKQIFPYPRHTQSDNQSMAEQV